MFHAFFDKCIRPFRLGSTKILRWPKALGPASKRPWKQAITPPDSLSLHMISCFRVSKSTSSHGNVASIALRMSSNKILQPRYGAGLWLRILFATICFYCLGIIAHMQSIQRLYPFKQDIYAGWLGYESDNIISALVEGSVCRSIQGIVNSTLVIGLFYKFYNAYLYLLDVVWCHV